LRFPGESVASQLHAVAGVAGEPDDHTVKLLDLLGHSGVPPLCAEAALQTASAYSLRRGATSAGRKSSNPAYTPLLQRIAAGIYAT